jgi:hypothetical protein
MVRCAPRSSFALSLLALVLASGVGGCRGCAPGGESGASIPPAVTSSDAGAGTQAGGREDGLPVSAGGITVASAGATRPILIAAAGDIAGRSNRHAETANLLLEINRKTPLDAILALGDLQYPSGDLHDFLAYYDVSWGLPALRALTRPVPGNHEYDQGRTLAGGYFDYFNGPGQPTGMAGDRDKGYYSFDLGAWHLVAVNSSDSCHRISCAVGSPMYRWLVADLAATRQKCVLAYWHHPRFQVGASHGDNSAIAPIWNALVDAGAEVVLAGHDHNFQQLVRMGKDGRPSPTGIRSFVVGTGGAGAYPSFDESEHPHAAETRFSRKVGVLLLTLTAEAFSWRFVASGGPDGSQVLAQGSDVCR